MSRIIILLVLVLPSTLLAAEKTGVIHTINTNLDLKKVLLFLDGKPVFSETGCSNYWIASNLDNEKFKTDLLPLLITAKTSKDQIRIVTSGCSGGYPDIVGVDFSPRN